MPVHKQGILERIPQPDTRWHARGRYYRVSDADTQCGMQPARLNVYVGVAKLEGIAKTDARLVALVDAAGSRMKAAA